MDLVADTTESNKVRQTAWRAIRSGRSYRHMDRKFTLEQLEQWYALCHRIFCDDDDSMHMRYNAVRSLQYLMERKGELAPSHYASMRQDWRRMSGDKRVFPDFRWLAFELLSTPRSERIAFHLAVLTDDDFPHYQKTRSFETLNRLADGLGFGLGKDVLVYSRGYWVPRVEAMNEQTASIVAAWFENHPAE